MSSRVEGHVRGLKASEQQALERLYRRRIPRDLSATPELVREAAELSREIGRRVGVLIDRAGAVASVFVGDATALPLPKLDRLRRGQGRLSGLRWLATALKGEEPSREDLNTVVRGRLDLLVWVLSGQDGFPSQLREAHLVPARTDGRQGVEVGPPAPPHEVRRDLQTFVHELEQTFEEAAPAGAETGADRLRPAVLAVVSAGERDDVAEASSELRELARAAGLEVKGEVVQRRARMDPHTLLGRGRVADLGALAVTTGAEVVVVNEELAPRQQVALEDQLDLDVIDRTQLILDVFARRARTHAGKLQVEAARLRYELPRIRGRGSALSQVGGGKGFGFGRTKGKGERKLELDRRVIRTRIDALERELELLRRQRRTRRRRRQQNQLPHVALVGYTNVGKSTLFNRLTDAHVLVEDAFFASLDPTVRGRHLPSGRRCLFSDSVGFIKRLPRDLVTAFGATLDELEDAALLLHVADASDPRVFDRIEGVRALLRDLGHGDRPELLVFNKADRVPDPAAFMPLAQTAASPRGSIAHEPLLISAREGDLEPLIERVDALLSELQPAPVLEGSSADELEDHDQ